MLLNRNLDWTTDEGKQRKLTSSKVFFFISYWLSFCFTLHWFLSLKKKIEASILRLLKMFLHAGSKKIFNACQKSPQKSVFRNLKVS